MSSEDLFCVIFLYLRSLKIHLGGVIWDMDMMGIFLFKTLLSISVKITISSFLRQLQANFKRKFLGFGLWMAGLLCGWMLKKKRCNKKIKLSETVSVCIVGIDVDWFVCDCCCCYYGFWFIIGCCLFLFSYFFWVCKNVLFLLVFFFSFFHLLLVFLSFLFIFYF